MKCLIPNIGSTSFKYRLLDMPSETLLAEGRIERIGRPGGNCADYPAAIRRCVAEIAGPGKVLKELLRSMPLVSRPFTPAHFLNLSSSETTSSPGWRSSRFWLRRTTLPISPRLRHFKQCSPEFRWSQWLRRRRIDVWTRQQPPMQFPTNGARNTESGDMDFTALAIVQPVREQEQSSRSKIFGTFHATWAAAPALLRFVTVLQSTSAWAHLRSRGFRRTTAWRYRCVRRAVHDEEAQT